jgi:hypothetical protein
VERKKDTNAAESLRGGEEWVGGVGGRSGWEELIIFPHALSRGRRRVLFHLYKANNII